MVKVNLEKEKTFEHILIEPDTYDSEITNISDIFKTPGYNGGETEKLIISFNLQYREGKLIQLPMFVTAVVSKGGGEYNNSKLYDILEKAEEIDQFTQFSQELEQLTDNQEKNLSFVKYLNKNLKGKKCKILVKIVTPKNGDVYSVVDKVIKFYN